MYKILKITIGLTLISFLSHPVFAEEEQVTVTGLRQDVSLQDAAVSVTVFTQEKIKDASITKIQDFFNLTPGVNLVHGATNTDSQLSIRGLYNARLTQSNFALLIDGILFPNPFALNRALVDLEQIEILKGTQSPLYGRNAIAGAVIINTVKPKGDVYAGSTKFSFGNNDAALLHQTINVPFSENFGLKLSFSSERTDGFYTNRYSTGNDVDFRNDREIALRLAGEIGTFSGGGKVLLDIKYTEDTLTGGATNYNGVSSQRNFGTITGSSVFTADPNRETDINNVNFQYLNNVIAQNRADRESVSVKLDIDFGNANALTIVLSRNDQNGTLLADGVGASGTFARAAGLFELVRQGAVAQTYAGLLMGAGGAALQGLLGTQAAAIQAATAVAQNQALAGINAAILNANPMATPLPALDAASDGILAARVIDGFLAGLAPSSPALQGAITAAEQGAGLAYFQSNPSFAQCLSTARSRAADTPAAAPFNYGPTSADDPSPIYFPSFGPTTCDGYMFQRRNQSDEQFEVRYTSNQNQDYAWVAGVSIQSLTSQAVTATGEDRNLPIYLQSDFNRAGNSPTSVFFSDTYEIEVAAVFGNLNFNITDSFNITLDMRFDTEKQTAINHIPTDVLQSVDEIPLIQRNLVSINNPGGNTYYNIIYNFNGGQAIPNRTRTYEAFQPKLAFSYRPEDSNLNLYASFAQGFRSGGFNLTGLSAAVNHYYCPNGYDASEIGTRPCNTVINGDGLFFVVNDPGDIILANPDPRVVAGSVGASVQALTSSVDDTSLQVFNVSDEYDQESSDNYELGVKASLNDGSIILDFAVYSNEVTNLQTFNSYAGAFGLLFGVANIDEATINGIEFSAQFIVSEDVSLGFSLSSIDSEITKNSARPYTVGNAVPFVTDMNANFNFQYKGKIGTDLDLLFRMDYSYFGTTWFSDVQDDTITTLFTRLDGACISAQNYGAYVGAAGAYLASLASGGAVPAPTTAPAIVHCSNTDVAFGADPGAETLTQYGKGNYSQTARDPYGLLNMRLDFIWNEDLRIGIWGKNVLGERYPIEAIIAPEAGLTNVLQSGGASYGFEISTSY